MFRSIFILCFVSLFSFACLQKKQEVSGSKKPSSQTTLSTFGGEADAIHTANQMFEAIGGKEKWASLQCIYVRAKHEEPQLEDPYQSEIWRSVRDFKLRIEQKSPDFHRLALADAKGGHVLYFEKDSLTELSTERLAAFRYGHDHNVYVLWHKLASLEGYEVKLEGEEEERIAFYQDNQFVCAFELNEQQLPHRFITKSQDGSREDMSAFRQWGNSNGFIHPAGGGPIDSSFTYQTEAWIPSSKSFEESYKVAYSLRGDL